MKMKKRLSLLTAAALASSAFAGLAFAATEDDLATISSNATFIAQNETTESFLKDSIHWNNQLLTLNGDNTYNTKKGNSLFNDTEVQNLLQVKQGRNMVLSVGGACTIDVYHDDNSGRIIQAGSTNKGTDYTVVQNVLANGTKNYDVDTITVPKAGLVYIGASGDVFVSVIDVKFGGGAPNPTDAPAATDAPAEPTAAPAELKAVEDTTTWTQADFEIGAYTAAQLSKNADLQINGAEGKAINVDGNAIKLGGTGSATNRNVQFIPGADGTVKVTAVNGNVSATDRFFRIENAGKVTDSEFIDTTNSVELTVNVKANEPVFIYSGKSGVNLTEIVYTKGASVVVDPTFVVENIGVFTEDAGNPAAAFKGEVTAGTYAIEGLYWRAYNGKAFVANYGVDDVTVASGSKVVLGLIIEVEDNRIDVNDVKAAIFAADVK